MTGMSFISLDGVVSIHAGMQEFFQLKLIDGSRQVSLGSRHSSGLSKYSQLQWARSTSDVELGFSGEFLPRFLWLYLQQVEREPGMT